MLREIAAKYYKSGFNCAESLLHAGNEYYNLGLSEKNMTIAAAFGGGFQTKDNICGAISGAACVISLRYIETKAHDDQENLKALCAKMMGAFDARIGERICNDVKPKYYTKEAKCVGTVEVVAEVLEQVINEWDAELANRK